MAFHHTGLKVVVERLALYHDLRRVRCGPEAASSSHDAAAVVVPLKLRGPEFEDGFGGLAVDRHALGHGHDHAVACEHGGGDQSLLADDDVREVDRLRRGGQRDAVGDESGRVPIGVDHVPVLRHVQGRAYHVHRDGLVFHGYETTQRGSRVRLRLHVLWPRLAFNILIVAPPLERVP